jgi:ribosomal protein S17E
MARYTFARVAGLGLLLAALGLTLGCSPAAMSMLLMPWTDDKIPPEFKLANKDKEVTVAVLATFGTLELRPEIAPADTELAEKFTASLRKRCQENKEKVKVLSPTQVRGLQNKQGGLASLSPTEVGKQLKADYVIALEITSLSLYERNSFRQLYRGNAEISISLFDVNKPEGEHKVFDKPYRTEYPGARGPIDASGSSEGQFRTAFLTKIARDLTKVFTGFPPDERFEMD